MRLRVAVVSCRRPSTSTSRPGTGRPWVSSTTTSKRAGSRSEALPQRCARMPSTSALGHRGRRCATVCTSPFGSVKLSSAVSSEGASMAGSFASMTVAAPCASVLASSLSATSLGGAASPPSPRCSVSSAPPSRLPRGGAKLKSSKPSKTGSCVCSSADKRAGARAMAPPASRFSCTDIASCAGAITGPRGSESRASTSGTRNSSTRTLPLAWRLVPASRVTS